MTKIKSTATPYLFPASDGFHGNDGSWSIFVMRIGTPAQDFYVLPAINGVNVVVPLAQGCVSSPDNITAPSNCGSLRGSFPFNNRDNSGFMANSSATWKNIGIFDLNLGNQYGIDITALYGYDSIGLAVQNSEGPTLDGQVVAGIARKQFFLGFLPLGIEPSNFSTFDDPQPSYLTSLKDNGIIPGLGFGYTAGAKHRDMTASLVLGGYDAAKYNINNSKTFQFGHDESVDFTVGLQNIVAERTFHDTVSLLTDGIVVSIDSTLPYLWLPEIVCDKFQSAFGLSYDENTELYVVNDTIHDQLKRLNPTVSLTLGDGTTAETGHNNTVVIDLPYAAFDQQASWPLMENATNYFPLKRAANSSQYTLGRAFLQEAYLSVDYERGIFNLSQARFDSPMPAQQLVSIFPQHTTETTSPPAIPAFSDEAQAGVAVGASLAGLLGLMLVFFCCRWQRRRRAASRRVAKAPSREFSTHAKEAGSTVVFEVHSYSQPNEVDSDGSQVYELSGCRSPLEMPLESRDGGSGQDRLHETPARR